MVYGLLTIILVTFLIVGDKAGAAKIKKANELGVTKFTEEEYLNLIK